MFINRLHHFIFYVKNAIVVFKKVKPEGHESFVSFVCHDFHSTSTRFVPDVGSWWDTIFKTIDNETYMG